MRAGLCRTLVPESAKGLGAFVAGLVLLCRPAAAEETKWRLAKPSDDRVMLVISDTDEANDAFGSLYLRCKPGAGYVSVVENNMRDKKLRTAIANLIVNDSYPTVQLDPAPERSVLEDITSSDDGGWGYRFQIGADGSAFNLFKTTGYVSFKIGNAAVHVGEKAGLENIAEFQSICRRQARNGGSK
ncbi:MAG: hypothetical protein JO141_15470 [Bradyrhizobium sp.]|nr:hypothetical protein [Bradyrhizobium sp.]